MSVLPTDVLTALNVKDGTWTHAGVAFDSIGWVGDAKTTKEKWDAKVIELEAEDNAKQYQRDRQYPDLGEQLDMQYWDEVNGTTTWKDAIAKVKADNPKPK